MNYCGYLVVETFPSFGKDINSLYKGIDRSPILGITNLYGKNKYTIQAEDLYENHLNFIGVDAEFISKCEIAKEIQYLLKLSGINTNILKCYVDRSISVMNKINNDNLIELGFDIAYFGGDFFSAIYNSINSPFKEINQNYLIASKHLNSNLLFKNYPTALQFLLKYKDIESAEKGDFCIYQIFNIV